MKRSSKPMAVTTDRPASGRPAAGRPDAGGSAPGSSAAEGADSRSKLRIAVVVSRFNASVTKKLLESAKSTLIDLGCSENLIEIFWVPGAFEIPQVVKRLATSDSYDGILPLGCVVQGETPHFHYVCDSVASGLTQIGIDHNVPVVFGVLTTENIDQALARAGGQSDKGVEAAMALVELIEICQQIGHRNAATQ